MGPPGLESGATGTPVTKRSFTVHVTAGKEEQPPKGRDTYIQYSKLYYAVSTIHKLVIKEKARENVFFK